MLLLRMSCYRVAPGIIIKILTNISIVSKIAQKNLFNAEVVAISMYMITTIFNNEETRWLDMLSFLSIEGGFRTVEIPDSK